MHIKDKWMDGLALRRENREAVIKEKRRRSRFSFCCTVLRIKLEATVYPQDTLALQNPERLWLWDVHTERLYPKLCCVSESLPMCCPTRAGAELHCAGEGGLSLQPQGQMPCVQLVARDNCCQTESGTWHCWLLLLGITRVLKLEQPSLWHGRNAPQSS